MSIRAVTQAVNERKDAIYQAEEQSRQIGFLVDTFRDAITAEPQVEHPPYPSQDATLISDYIQNGRWLLIRAGQVSTLTLSGMAGWHVDQATLTVENRSPRLAFYPSSGALVLSNDPTRIMYDSVTGTVSQFKWGSIAFDPPRFVRRILFQGGESSGLSYKRGDRHITPLYERIGDTQVGTIDQRIDGLKLTTLESGPLANRIAIVQDNAAQGLSVLTADDRLLHRAGQKLVAGQSATTPDLSATLNEATGDTVIFHLTSQSDCVIFIKGSLVRRRVAEGFTAEVPEVLPVGPWVTAAATPTAALSTAPQTVTVTGKIRKTGPRRMGLTASAAAGRQIVRAHPRLRLVQPFQPVTTAAEAPLTISGLWLFVDAVPEAETRLTAQITPWDARNNSVGAPLARASATINAELGPYLSGPDGLLATWVPFEEPCALDPDDQTLLHALVLSEIDGPAGLVEAPKTHAQLSAARFRDVSRSEVLTTRGFGAADKALLFDLGCQADTAPVVISAGGTSQTVQAGLAEGAFSVTLPGGPLTLSADAAVEVSDLAARSATGPM